uniref:Facilitated trehalose transporter Tret1-like isoform X1 n=1 Tax=Hirondellea gigas TaxID=1518452 RepID=A0A6A7G433_9CRUS
MDSPKQDIASDTSDPSWGWTVHSDDEATQHSASKSRAPASSGARGYDAEDPEPVFVHDAAADDSNAQYDDGGEQEPLISSEEGAEITDSMGSEGIQSSRPSLSSRVSRASDLVTPSHIKQYIAALAATMGAFSMGCILGYSSPAGAQLQGNSTGIECPLVDDEPLSSIEISWFSSAVNLGALIGAPVTGFLINSIGRRGTMMASLVIFLLGWGLIGGGQNFAMLVAGRVFCGFCAGCVSLTVPTYLSEIASTDVRGMLGSGFQLMVVLGLLYTYSVGAVICWRYLALASFVPAIIFSVSMYFCKESPAYLLANDKHQDAMETLQFFRGEKYNVGGELLQLRMAIDEGKANKVSFKDLKAPHILRPLIISLALMFFQQFSGINAILFNLTTIFEQANVDMSADACSIIIAVVQVVATVVASVLIDRAGRKILLLVSSSAMAVALVAMGVYFYMAETDQDMSSLGWLPLVSLIGFIAFFSVGYGPVPWVMMSELFSPDVRELASTLATLTNWSMSFVVTLIFKPLQSAINNSGVYWMFAGFCVVNFIFCFVFVKETKGLTSEQISALFGGPGPRRESTASNSSGHRNESSNNIA